VEVRTGNAVYLLVSVFYSVSYRGMQCMHREGKYVELPLLMPLCSLRGMETQM